MKPLLAAETALQAAALSRWPRLRCPVCVQDIPYHILKGEIAGSQCVRCENCRYELTCEEGIWDALPAERERYYARFHREYESIRSQEGRGSGDADYYLALPFRDLSGRNSRQWKIRARTWRYLQRRILPQLCRELGRPLQVLDLGAGNGWLSYRLSQLGHRPVAVDLLGNAADGLAASLHYLAHGPHQFPRFRAELDRLPFADSQFDCAIFNASFHYSENYERTLLEAFRCLRPDGRVIIADTAWYARSASGAQMLKERREAFIRGFGFPSDALKSEEFLTNDRLDRLAASLGIAWEIHKPWYGCRWAMRPWIARWKKRREPSRFRIYVGRAVA